MVVPRPMIQENPSLKRDRRKNRKVVPLILGFIILPIFVIAFAINKFHGASASLRAREKAGVLPEAILPQAHEMAQLRAKTSNNDQRVEIEVSPSAKQSKAGNDDITKNRGSNSVPSAKSMLTQDPPFDDDKVIKLSNELVHSPNTIVTGYLLVPSKYASTKYDGWMKNMLSVQDAMVIFTQPDKVDQIKQLRSHATNRTVIVPVDLGDLPIGKVYSKEFWQSQLDRDPEKRIHRSYELFWIWLSKSWWTTQAIRMNFFQSDLFMWSDIGCFRDKKYNNKTVIQHRELVPPNEMIMMAHHKPNPPAERLFNDKYKHKDNFYHSGSQMAGYKDTWIRFHELFLETIDKFVEKNMIIVEDQAVLQSTCLLHPEICAYVPFDQVKRDNHYFGLRYVLRAGGEYNYWRYTDGVASR